MNIDITDKCPNCGKFVSKDEGFYTREKPDSDLSYMIICCDKECADQYEKNFKANQWDDLDSYGCSA